MTSDPLLKVRQDHTRQLGDASHVVIAALLRDDLAHHAASKVRRRHFADALLQDAAAFGVGSISTFGVAEMATIHRLLLRNYRPERVELELRTIDRLTKIITTADVDEALAELSTPSNGVAA